MALFAFEYRLRLVAAFAVAGGLIPNCHVGSITKQKSHFRMENFLSVAA